MGREDRADRPSREELIRRFDANGNGRLDPEERQRLFEEMRNRRGARATDRRPGEDRRARGDLPRGRADRGERPGRRAWLRRFDADGNGRLDPEERERAREQMRSRQGARATDARTGDARRGDRQPGDRRPGSDRGSSLLRRYDTDGDGKLDAAELGRLLREMRANRGPGRGRGERARSDRDRDRGQPGDAPSPRIRSVADDA